MTTVPPRRRPRRWSLAWLAAIAGVGIGLGILASIPLLRADPSGTEGSLVGEAAPPIDLRDLQGRRWTMADGAGRLTWVNFWATNCEPCRTEMPAMQRLAELYGERLLILGIDWGEERAAVDDFVVRYAIHYPVLLDPTLDTFFDWSSGTGLPRHYFVDGDGTVVREVIGPLAPARMIDLLEELIGPAEAAAHSTYRVPFMFGGWTKQSNQYSPAARAGIG